MNGKTSLLRSTISAASLAVLLSLPAAAAAMAATPTDKPDPNALSKQGFELLDAKRYRDAVEVFEKADKLAGGQCGVCQVGLSRAWLGAGKADKSVDAARRATGLLKTPEALGQAYNQLGVSLLRLSKSDFAEAEAAFRKAQDLGGTAGEVARYNLAEVLFREKRYTDSIDTARQFLQSKPEGLVAERARTTLCLARRADASPFLTPEQIAEHQVACDPNEVHLVGKTDPAVAAKVSRPEKLFGDPPAYPESARRDKVRGTVVIESIIDEDGCVRNLLVCRSVNPDLDRSAMDAMSTWVFKPATLEGRPVKVYYTLSVNYTVGRSH
jgi:TonB family protein